MPLHCLPVLALVSSRAWTIAGWTMLHFLWVGAALGLLATILRMLLRRASPQQRYVAALMLFSLLAIAPLGIAVRVSQSLAAESQPRSTPIPSETRETWSSGEEQPQIAAAPSWSAGTTRTAGYERPISSGNVFSTDRHQSAARAVTGSGPDPRLTWIRNVIHGSVGILPGLWIAGSSVLLALTFAGLHGADHLRRRSQRLLDGELVARCSSLARSLRISRRVALAVCDRLAGPVLVGLVRPCILLPSAALTGWTPQQLDMVLLHELAHIRRWDNLVNLFQRLVESLLFFQPAVWWVSDWIRLEREHCCDDAVVSRTGHSGEYARTLLMLSDSIHHLGQIRAEAAGPRTGSSIAGNDLVSRVRHLLKKGAEPMPSSRAALLLMLASLVAALLLPLGLHNIATRAEDPLTAPQNHARTLQNDDAPAPQQAHEPPNDDIAPMPVQRAHVAPGRSLMLASRREGVLESVAVRAGEAVKPGQVLASLPQDALRIAEIEVRYADAATHLAEAKYAEAREANDNIPGAVPATTVRQLSLDFERSSLQREKAKAEYESLQNALVIRSPIDGIVRRVIRQAGEWVNSGDPVIELVAAKDGDRAAASAPPPEVPVQPATEPPAEAAPAASQNREDTSRKIVWPVTIDARVSPGQILVLSSKGEGVLESVAVRAGQVVRKGETVVSLPNDARALAALQVAQAELAPAEQAAAFARRQHDRVSDLFRKNTVSQDQFAKSQANAEQAQAELKQARARLAQAEAQLESVEATLKIRTPIDGIVTRVHHHPGESVKVGDPVVEVVSTDRMQIEGSLPYWYAWSIQSGARVTVRVKIPGLDLPVEKETFAGRLTYVDPSIRPLDRQFRVLAEVENRRELLKSGLEVIMKIHKPEDGPQDEKG